MTQLLQHDCASAVTWIHEFFVAWFRGTCPNDDATWQALDGQLDPDFVLVSPGGQALPRATLLNALRPRHGSHRATHFQIEVRNVTLQHVADAFVIVGYEEWQQIGDQTTARHSTAVLARVDTGLRWLAVHETWMPGLAPAT